MRGLEPRIYPPGRRNAVTGQDEARILSRAALAMKADRVRPRAFAARSMSSSSAASSERLALTERPLSNNTGTVTIAS